MIRKMNESDLDVIMGIWYHENIASHDFIPKSYWKDNFDEVRAAISEAEVYVFEENGRVRGFVGMQENYIAGIFIRREAQSLGIGGKLLEYAKSVKKELTLGVYVLNEKAVNFYILNGFEISERNMDEETGQYEYIMKWTDKRDA